MMQTILADQREREQMTAMARVFTKVDRILSGERVECVVEDSHVPAPSYTDGQTITFNRRMIGNVASEESIIAVTGLNLHEYAHVWLTPRAYTTVGRHIKAHRLSNAFNMLEDQRIETFLAARYLSSIPYLTATVMHYCTDNPRYWDVNHVLIYGRRYLPKAVRDEFRRRFVRPELLGEFEAIIDAYRTIVYPTDEAQAIDLITQFDLLLKQLPSSPSDPHGHSTGKRDDITAGRPADEQEQTDAAEKAEEFDERLKEEDERQDEQPEAEEGESEDESEDEPDGENDDDGAGTDPTEDEDDAGSDEDGTEDEGEPDAAGAGDESDSDDEGDAEGDPDDGGADEPGGMDDQDLHDLIDGTLDDIRNDSTVRSEVADKQTAITRGGDVDIDLDRGVYDEYHALAEDVMVARKFGAILDQVRADTDPGWKRETPSGRVNIQRVIQGADFSQMFDTWDEGNNEASDIECVINLDTSSSMAQEISLASRAMWIIKRGLESIEGRVTVLSYDTDCKLVYDGHQKVSRTKYRLMKATGITKPMLAVEQAVRILEASTRTNRIFITITDGAWHAETISPEHPRTADEMIEMLNERGVTTALAYISNVESGGHIDAHNCDVAAVVSNPLEIVGFAKAIVRQSMYVPRSR